MKKFLFFLCFFLFCTLPAAIPEFRIVREKERGQSGRIESGEAVLKIKEDVFPYLEAVLIRPVACLGGTAKLTFASENPEKIKSAAIRLRDEEGEIFHILPGKPPLMADGHVLFEFPLDGRRPHSSWGKKVNRKIDGTPSISGFVVRGVPGAADLTIRLIAMEILPPGKGNSEYKIPLPSFDGEFDFRGTPARYENGICRLENIKKNLRLRDRAFSIRSFPATDRIELHAKLNSGSGKVRISGFGGNGKKFSAEAFLRPGIGTLLLPIDAEGPVKFDAWTILPGKSGCSLELISADLIARGTKPESIDLKMASSNPVSLFNAGKQEVPTLRFQNRGNSIFRGTAETTFSDYYGRTLRRTFSLTLKPDAFSEFQLPLPTFGIWKVSAKISMGNDHAVKDCSLAYFIPAGPTPERENGFFMAVCSHPAWWGKKARETEAVAAGLCGAKMVRASASWGNIQPKRDTWDFSLQDELVALFGAQGIELQSGLCFTPRWAAPEPLRKSKVWTDWNRAMPELSAWKKYAYAMGKRYRGKIRFWEIWNEPDLYSFANFSASEYVLLLKSAYTELKSADPESRVMTGGFASILPLPNRDRDNVAYQLEVLRNGLGFYDVHAYHQHGTASVFERTIDNVFLPARKATGAEKVPWFANETAIASTGGQERMQAETLFRKMIFSWARGAIGYTWYDLRNDGFDPYNSEHHYGLLTFDFQPKFAYAVFNTLASALRGAVFIREETVPNHSIRIFRLRRGNDLLFALWPNRIPASGVPILFRGNISSAERIDLMGNTLPLSVQNGILCAVPPGEPTILRMRNTASVDFCGPLLELQSAGAVPPGVVFNAQIMVHNPFYAPLTGTLSAGGKSMRVEIPAGKTQTFALPLPAPKTSGRRFTEKMQFSFGNELNGTVPLRFETAFVISSKRGNGRDADFILNRKDQTFSFFEGQPQKVHLLWRGPSDLSAEIRLENRKDALHIFADVTDDIHHPVEPGQQLWRGDSIQIALNFPFQAGEWEIGAGGRDSNGIPGTFVWRTPRNIDAATVNRQIHTTILREGSKTRYELILPWKALNLSPSETRHAFQFNLMVNDHDGECRKGGIQLAPGLKNTAAHPFLLLEHKTGK